MAFLHEALIYLAAAVVAVLVCKRLGLGSVLGYMAAGVVIGPGGLGLIGDVESVLHFSELGVVLLLFLIGLELQPQRLWQLRRAVFGLGGAQVLLTTAALSGPAMLLGLPAGTAVLVGATLSLSSTAFALQLLAEKNQLATAHGRDTFAILLLQDLAVIPLLAVLPFLGGSGAHPAPGWQGALRLVAVLAAVVASKYLLRPLLRLVARQAAQELFTATALLVVVGTAVGVGSVGLSMALGAFLAGVLLANSEYRHELEANIEPFKGLLLGLFFVAVGMSVNLGLVAQRPLAVAAAVCGLCAVKAAVLAAIGLAVRRPRATAWRTALAVAQGGEFAFVLLRQALAVGAVDAELADLLVAVVTLSMALSPLLYAGAERLAARRAGGDRRAFDVAPDEDVPVVIAGCGRGGEGVGWGLCAKRIAFTALDASAEQIDFISRFGAKVFYGDASRVDLLRAARLDRARLFVLAIDDPDASLRTARTVLAHFPQVTLLARARNRQHAYALMAMGVRHVFRETFASSLELTQEVLQALGLTYSESASSVERFRDHDEEMMQQSYAHRDDDDKLRAIGSAARRELRTLFEHDAEP